MSTGGRARALAVEAAERRVLGSLRTASVQAPSPARRLAVLAAAAVLFAVTFAVRLAIKDPSALVANFYVVPIALLAIEFGTRAGVLGAGLALGLVFAWSALQTVHLGALGYTARGAALLVTGAVVGSFSERLRKDIVERQHAQRDLSLYADELSRANQQLAQSVERLEAFAEIARAVGGETDLERVLSLILARARDIVGARSLQVFLPEGEHVQRLDELVAGASRALLVPLRFRGQTLGVLAAVDRDDGRALADEDEQLHDQTLQGLAGARMVLSAGLAREDPVALRDAVQTADAHIGIEMRSLRDLVTELRPAALDDLGLGPAIESLAKRQAAAGGFALQMTIDFDSGERSREIEDAIYRIVQEALSNVTRHAGAERARLLVRHVDERVEVSVEDDGCGFATDGPSEGFGLIGMRERAHLLGGRSRPRTATALHARTAGRPSTS